MSFVSGFYRLRAPVGPSRDLIREWTIATVSPVSEQSQDWESLSDAELMSAVAGKQESAFAELFRRYSTRVFNLAYRQLGNREDAELITQDVFLRIWRHSSSYRGSAQPWTWIYRIAINTCLSHKARKRLVTEELDETIPAAPNSQPDTVYHQSRLQAIVQKALADLPAEQRMAIVLYRYEGLSYDEIAAVMNKSRNAVASLLFRAREQLRIRLLPYVERGEISP